MIMRLNNFHLLAERGDDKSSFTLVELMVVAVMVAVLAAIAIPLMVGNTRRAIATEAEAALGTIRTNLRSMFTITRDYTNDGRNGTLDADDSFTAIPGFQDDDLDGRYFSDECYTIRSISADAYVIECDGSASTADQAAKVANMLITINQDGEINRESGF